MLWLSWLALRELWIRRWRAIVSLLALALTVGLIVATGSIAALMRASVAAPTPLRGRENDLWVASAHDVDYDLPADLATKIADLPGVADVQSVLRRPVLVHTPETLPDVGQRADTLTLLGVEPATYFDFHDLALAAGTLPSADAPGLVALAPWAFVRELSLGQPVTVTPPSGEVGLPLAGLLRVEDLAAAQQGLVLYAPLEVVTRLYGLGDVVTVLEVRPAPGISPRRLRADLQQTLGLAYVVSSSSAPVQGTQLWQRLVLGALLFVDGLIFVGSVVLVYAVFATAARSRRRQIALMRATGARQDQVLVLLVFEAGLLGLAGGALGLALGFFLAWAGAHLVVPGTDLLAAPPMPTGSLLLAVGLGLLGSLAGAIGPAVRAVRQPPVVALRTAPLTPRLRPVGGCLAELLSRLARWLPIEMTPAAANLARDPRRAVLIVVTLALILAMALGNVGVLSLLGEELAATFGRLTGGDYVVLPGLTTISFRELSGQDTSDVPPLGPGLLAALEDLSDQVWLMGGTTAHVEALQVFPGQPTLLLDIEGYARMGGFRFLEGDWPGALEAFRQGPALLLAPAVARRLDVGLDDLVSLDTPGGPVDFYVAGIGDSEFTTCILDLTDGATYLGANEVNGVMVQLRPGSDGEEVRQALLDAVQTHGGALLSLGQVSARLREVFAQVRLSLSLLVGLTGLVAGLGVVNAVLSSVAERRREIGLLRAVGATRQQVGRLILSEMALLGAASALLGAILGWAVTLLFLTVANAYLGLAVEGSVSFSAWLPLLTATIAGLALWPVLAVVGGLVPALHAARLPILQALYDAPLA